MRRLRSFAVGANRAHRAAAFVTIGLLLAGFSPTQAKADFGAWGRVLAEHAKPSGFDYRALHSDASGQKDLAEAVKCAAKMSEDAPLHAWLNAYNVTVVNAVMTRYPLKSVMDVPGFFKTVKHRVAGKDRTLDEIEHQVIRKRFKDARVHVALNCGARSCPRLHNKLFSKKNVNAILDRLSRQTVASNTHVAIKDDALRVSEIFHWFADDFIAAKGSVVAWLKAFDKTGRLNDVAADAKLGKLPYDWRLNQAK